MGTSGTFGGSKNGLVPSWVDEPASPPAAGPDSAEPASANGDGTDGQDQNGEAAPARHRRSPTRPYLRFRRVRVSAGHAGT